ERALEPFGFQTVYLSRYSFPQKVRLFNNAEVIISATGAGLTSLFFCDKKGTVIELFPQGFVNTHYYNIAFHAGMNHIPLICSSKRASREMVEGQLEDLFVDIDEVKNVLQTIV